MEIAKRFQNGMGTVDIMLMKGISIPWDFRNPSDAEHFPGQI